MAGRQAPIRAPQPKQPAGSPSSRGAQAPAQAGRCLGAASQLAAVRRTLRQGHTFQLQAGGKPAGAEPAAANRTGLPDGLKAGVEVLSRISLDGVKVHYNSSKPAQLNAHAFAQGRYIHLAPGQERHLPHETWHVVQQAQGRVKPTLQLKGGVLVNDDKGLEYEADVMGARALARAPRRQSAADRAESPQSRFPINAGATVAGQMPVQRVVYPDLNAMWAGLQVGVTQAAIEQIIGADAALLQIYHDVAQRLPNMDFILTPGRVPEAAMGPNPGAVPTYDINYDLRANLAPPWDDPHRYVGAILHEMMHVASALQYATGAPGHSLGHMANANLLPAGGAPVEFAELGLTAAQRTDPVMGSTAQQNIMEHNWDTFDVEATLDLNEGRLNQAQFNWIRSRSDYARAIRLVHYDTVLTDVLYYMQAEQIAQTRSYAYAHRMLTEANGRRLTRIGPVQAIPRAPLPPPPAPTLTWWQWFTQWCRGR